MAAVALVLSSLPLSVLLPPGFPAAAPVARAQETWAAQNTGGLTSDLYALAAIDANNAWAAGAAGAIRRTTDGGATWVVPNLAAGTPTTATVTWSGADAGSATTGWLVGSAARILRTTDSGATWADQTNPLSGLNDPISTLPFELLAVDAVDANTAWATGTGGAILRTTAAGAPWVRLTSPTVNRIEGLAALNASTAWIGDENGSIRKTADGGTNWSQQVQLC